MVPREYPNECIVKHPTPYEIAHGTSRGAEPRKGLLDIGRVVWTKQSLAEAESAGRIDAFVFGVGTVELDPHNLTQN